MSVCMIKSGLHCTFLLRSSFSFFFIFFFYKLFAISSGRTTKPVLFLVIIIQSSVSWFFLCFPRNLNTSLSKILRCWWSRFSQKVKQPENKKTSEVHGTLQIETSWVNWPLARTTRCRIYAVLVAISTSHGNALSRQSCWLIDQIRGLPDENKAGHLFWRAFFVSLDNRARKAFHSVWLSVMQAISLWARDRARLHAVYCWIKWHFSFKCCDFSDANKTSCLTSVSLNWGLSGCYKNCD